MSATASHLNGASLSFDAIALDATALTRLDASTLAALAQRLAAALSAVAAAQFEHAAIVQEPKQTDHTDRMLDAGAIALELGTSRRWVFRNCRKIPCIRRVSRKSLTASAAQLRRWRDLQRP